LHSDLVQRPVVDSQQGRTPSNIDTERFPGKRLLKDPLPQVASEEEDIRAFRQESREKSQLRDANVSCFVHHHEFKWRMGAFSELRRDPAEHA